MHNIEAKGLGGGEADGSQRMKACCRPGERYRLYIVFDCAMPAPRLLPMRNSFAKLLVDRRDSTAYAPAVAALRKAAEPERQ